MTPTSARALPDADARAVLERRARHLAEPKVAESHARDQAVRLEVSGRWYSVPSSLVREVLAPGPVAGLPGRGHALQGVRSAGSGVVVLADLSALSTQVGVSDPDECFVVVIDGTAPLGLLADRVTMADSTEQPPATPRTGGFTGGMTPDGVVLVDVEALLADARLSVPIRTSDPEPPIEGTT